MDRYPIRAAALYLSLVLGAISAPAQNLETDRAELRYLTVSDVSAQVTPPGGTDQLTFVYDRSGYTIRIEFPRFLSEGTLVGPGPGTRRLELKSPAKVRIEVTGSTATAKSHSITVTSAAGACGGEPKLFQPGRVDMSLNCSLGSIAAFSGGAVGNSIVQAFWFVRVDALTQLIFVSPTYEARVKSVDLAIHKILPVQVVQNISGTVPMIPGKKTLVRAFLRSEGPDAKPLYFVNGTLRARGFERAYLGSH